MPITKIVLELLQQSASSVPNPPTVVLAGDQGALIPNIGDLYDIGEFFLPITGRNFNFTGNTLHIYLYCPGVGELAVAGAQPAPR
jgi:hypothetical protein